MTGSSSRAETIRSGRFLDETPPAAERDRGTNRLFEQIKPGDTTAWPALTHQLARTTLGTQKSSIAARAASPQRAGLTSFTRRPPSGSTCRAQSRQQALQPSVLQLLWPRRMHGRQSAVLLPPRVAHLLLHAQWLAHRVTDKAFPSSPCACRSLFKILEGCDDSWPCRILLFAGRAGDTSRDGLERNGH